MIEKTQVRTPELSATDEAMRAAERVMSRRPGRNAIFGAGATTRPSVKPSETSRVPVGTRPHRAPVRDRLAELAEEIEALAARVDRLNRRKLGRPPLRTP